MGKKKRATAQMRDNEEREKRWNRYWIYIGAGLAVAGFGTSVGSPCIASLFFLAAVVAAVAAIRARWALSPAWTSLFAGVALVGFLVADGAWLNRKLKPSFAYVKPGVWANRGKPNQFWIFLVCVRGDETLVNARFSMMDKDKEAAVLRFLDENPNFPVPERGPLLWSYRTGKEYRELYPHPFRTGDNEADSFEWKPQNIEGQHYFIQLAHRDGAVDEELEVKHIGGDGDEVAYAMKVVDEHTKEVLINCRDPKFPPDDKWGSKLSACFPSYPDYSRFLCLRCFK